MNHKNEQVIKLNDAFRTSMTGGVYAFTDGIAALNAADLGEVLHKVRDHTHFTPSLDPEEEHSGGAFDHNGQRIIWEINCYDQQWRCDADPADPEVTRVLVIMLTSEC